MISDCKQCVNMISDCKQCMNIFADICKLCAETSGGRPAKFQSLNGKRMVKVKIYRGYVIAKSDCNEEDCKVYTIEEWEGFMKSFEFECRSVKECIDKIDDIKNIAAL